MRLRERIASLDEDCRRTGKSEFPRLVRCADGPEPNLGVTAADGLKDIGQPLPNDRQVGAALDEPHFDVHSSRMRLPRPSSPGRGSANSS
jgi:hypothetical protein